jgi:hypothetical protein
MPRLFTLTITSNNRKHQKQKPEFWCATVDPNTAKSKFIKTLTTYILSFDTETNTHNLNKNAFSTLDQVLHATDELLCMGQMAECASIVLVWLQRRVWLSPASKRNIHLRIQEIKKYIFTNMEVLAHSNNEDMNSTSTTYSSAHVRPVSPTSASTIASISATSKYKEEYSNNDEFLYDSMWSSDIFELELDPHSSENENTQYNFTITHEDTTPLHIERTLSSDSVNWLGSLGALNLDDSDRTKQYQRNDHGLPYPSQHAA